MVSTLLYLLFWYVSAPFWMWAFSSLFIGLGFTFFSGATEAWLIDAMHVSKYEMKMEHLFAQGQIASGAAMLSWFIARRCDCRGDEFGRFLSRKIFASHRNVYNCFYLHERSWICSNETQTVFA